MPGLAASLQALGHVCVTSFSREAREEVFVGLVHHLPESVPFVESQPRDLALRVLESPFSVYEGKPTLHSFVLDLDRTPPFERKVLQLTSSIPRGYVSTYGGVASALGKSGAARAVGNAEARNPFPPLIPCHRVVRGNLTVGGYGGRPGTKRLLLEWEGMVFLNDRIAREHLWVLGSEGLN